MPAANPGLYFDDFPLEQEYESPGRTITETDLVVFSGVSGDYNPLHTDIEFAKQGPFGQRIAHGMLVLSIVTGLVSKMGILDGTAIAFLGLTWKFSKPVYINDTVRLTMKATKKRAVGAEAGMVIAEVVVRNQRGEKVQSGELTVMIKRQAAAGS